MVIQKYLKDKLIPLLYTIGTLIVFLCTNPVLSGAGDLNIAEFLLSEGKMKSGCYYISPALCDMLHPLNRIWHINWWSIFSVFWCFVGLFVILCYIDRRIAQTDLTIRIVVSALFALLFWEMILKSEVNYSQTTTCILCSGFLLSMDAVCSEDWCKHRHIKLISGFLLFVLANLVRGGMSRLLLPFLFMACAYLIVFPLTDTLNIQSVLSQFAKRLKVLLPCVLLAVSIMLGNAIEKFYYTTDDDYRTWKDTNAAASAICDYPEQYPEYWDNPEIYDQNGIRDSWLNMIYDFCYSDRNTFTPEYLSIMKAYRTPSEMTVADFEDMMKEHHLLWIITISFVGIIVYLYGIRKLILPIVGALFGSIVCSLYCIYRGRIVWRVTNGYLLFALLSVLVMISIFEIRQTEQSTDIGIYGRLNWIAFFFLIMLVGFAAVKDEKGEISKPVAKVTDQSAADILESINENDNTLYLYFDLIRFGGAYNLWKGHAPDYLDNYIPLTTCFVYGCREELESRGIRDLYTDLLTKPKIYVEYSSNTLNSFYKYLCDFYDPHTSVSIAEEPGGGKYFRFSSVVVPQGIEHIDNLSSVTPNWLDGAPDRVRGVYLIECRLDEKNINSYSDYWINVTDNDTGQLYSYGMNTEEAKVLGSILHMEGTWNPENCRMVLAGVNDREEIMELADITEIFLSEYSGVETED